MIAEEGVMPKTRSFFFFFLYSHELHLLQLRSLCYSQTACILWLLQIALHCFIILVEVGHHIYALCDNFTTSGAKF